MPVLKHAKKKLRQDVKRTRANKRIRTLYKELLKKARTASGQAKEKAVSQAFSAIDKAAKQNIIHKNKAARLKSSLAKTGNTEVKAETRTASSGQAKATKKPTVKKPPAKKTAKE